jgi:diguanylate cyclase (GGDEF)-like protein
MRRKIAGVAARARAGLPAGGKMLRVLVVLGVLLALLIAAGGAILLRNLHERTILAAERELEGLSLVLAEQADRSLQAIDLVQDRIIDGLRERGVVSATDFVAQMSGRTVHDNLRATITALPQINAVTIIDSQGKLVNFSRYWPIPEVDVSDRDYFQALTGDVHRDRFISGPVKNRGDGAWTMYVVRRVSAPDGSFLGLVLGGVALNYFETLYQAVALAPDYALALYSVDDVLVTRYPRREEAIGHAFPSIVAHDVRSTQESHGARRNTSPIDGVERLVAARALAHYPLVMNVTRSLEGALVPWEQQVSLLGGGVLCLDVALIGFVVFAALQVSAQDKLRRAEADARGERELRTQYTRFGVALDNMTQGLCMFDGYDSLVVVNVRLLDMLGVREVPPPSMALTDGIRLIARAGGLRRGEVRRAGAALRRILATRVSSRVVWELLDGRALAVAFQPMADGGWLLTLEDVTEQRQAAARIAFLAHHDPLTQLPNRNLFHERLMQSVQLSARGVACAVLCLDLDGFKEVNDSMGHAAGDDLLRQVADRLRHCVRENCVVARLGGDEFAVIQPAFHQVDAGSALATRIIEVIGAPFEIRGEEVMIGVSIGIAVSPGDGLDAEMLLKHADIALYRAKADGRGRFRFFESQMNTKLEARRALEVGLRRALAAGEFEMLYQPLLRVADRRIVGFEALMRWRHPLRGLINPSEFIPVAEETGQIVPMGELALQMACAEAATWPDDVTVAVNLSPVQFKSHALVEAVASALKESGLSPRRLELEITETVLLRDTEDTLVTLRRLHELGIDIALDDFGTGYSSLSYISKFSFDKVKIDRSFVHDLARRSEAAVIIRTIIGLCSHLQVTSLAEGVETEEQFAALAREDCTQVQGFLFSPPVAASEVAALLVKFGRVRQPTAA